MLAGKGFTLSRPRAAPSRTSPPHLGQKVRLAGGLRYHLRVKVSAAARSLSAVKDQMFNRKEELADLNEVFDDIPSELFILLGPANCGKSRLLQEVKKYRESGQAAEGMEAVVKASTVGPSVFQTDLGKLFAPAADKAPMASIIDSLTIFLEATRPLPYKPVIVIDEANKLMRWRDDPGHTQLRDLLDFFKTIVLASSESFVINFFEKEGLHTKQYITHEVEDLATVDEAKKFVEDLMICEKAPSSFFDTTEDGENIDMGPRVYELCGGNIGLLERCARHSKRKKSWKEGLKAVGMDLKNAVQRGLSPGAFSRTGGSRSPAAWTKEDYKTVLRKIALAKEQKHAVSFKKLRDTVGEDALLSMVEWNLVSLRRKSEWAKDLPETLFADLNDTKLVTMPSPAELYFVLKMYEHGELEAAEYSEMKKFLDFF